MLTTYIQAAMHHARYEILEDGTFYGHIPGFPGLWANEPMVEVRREELRTALEDWILVGLRHGDPLPVVGDIDLNVKKDVA